MTLVRISFPFFSFTSPFRINLVETSHVVLDHFHEYIIVAHSKTFFKYRMCFINSRYSDSIFLLNPSAIVFSPTSFPARFGENAFLFQHAQQLQDIPDFFQLII